MPIERISIFDLAEVTANPAATLKENTANGSAPAKKAKAVKKKAVFPQELSVFKVFERGASFKDFYKTLCDFLRVSEVTSAIQVNYYYRYTTGNNTHRLLKYCDGTLVPYASVGREGLPFNHLSFRPHYNVHELLAVYAANDGSVWKAEGKIETPVTQISYGGYMGENSVAEPFAPIKVALGEFKQCTKLIDTADALFLNTEANAGNILKSVYPYAYKMLEERQLFYYTVPYTLLMAPQLEQLVKADFNFAEMLLRDSRKPLDTARLDQFNRLTKPGTKPKDIFKCSKNLWQALKDERNLARWDIMRKMEKSYPLSKDTLQQVVDKNYYEKDMEKIHSILSKKYNGKPVFTWDTLQTYLDRLDMYQAIGLQEALMLLKDYLEQCRLLGIEPRIDSDSLKREHDVTARTLREKRDEIRAEKLNKACSYLAENDYEEGVYFIRGIRNYDDLIDEARQQRNCVASYADSIASRRSLIYVMREKRNPNASLITVELSSDCSTIRQKFLACNQPVRNKAQTEFLERWLRLCKKRKATGAASIAEMTKGERINSSL